MLSCVLIGVALAGLGGPVSSPIQAKAKAVANDTKAEKMEHLAALKKELAAKEAELAHVEEEKKELSAKEATLKPKKTPLATELLAGRGVPAKAAANDTKAEKLEHLAALKKELAAKEATLAPKKNATGAVKVAAGASDA